MCGTAGNTIPGETRIPMTPAPSLPLLCEISGAQHYYFIIIINDSKKD